MKPRLVALRVLGLGDLLTAVPALRALARAFPDHHRTLVTSKSMAPLVEQFDLVDEVVTAEPLASLPPALHHSDLAVNLHGSGPQSHRLLQACSPRRLLAFANQEAAWHGPEWNVHEHEVARWCRLLEEYGIPADPSDLDLPPPADSFDSPAIGATLLHPGAAYQARRWPVERWSAVARAEVEAGRTVLLTGGPEEVELCVAVADGAGLSARSILAGQTSIADLCVAVASADRMVVGDTGVAHLATAYRTPSVVLFGPMSPALWGPPPERPQHIALWAGLSGDPHGDVLDLGLDLISVDQVLDALSRLPQRATVAGKGSS